MVPEEGTSSQGAPTIQDIYGVSPKGFPSSSSKVEEVEVVPNTS
jgi:hypothetical protein